MDTSLIVLVVLFIGLDIIKLVRVVRAEESIELLQLGFSKLFEYIEELEKTIQRCEDEQRSVNGNNKLDD